MRVVVIEDDDEQAYFLTRGLEEDGATVTRFADAQSSMLNGRD